MASASFFFRLRSSLNPAPVGQDESLKQIQLDEWVIKRNARKFHGVATLSRTNPHIGTINPPAIVRQRHNQHTACGIFLTPGGVA